MRKPPNISHLNFFSQSLQLNSFFPSWTEFTCLVKCELFLKVASHFSHLNDLFPSCIFAIWADTVAFEGNLRWHITQLKGFLSSWIVEMWFFKFFSPEKPLLQILHLYGSFPSWTDSMWYFKLLESLYLASQVWQ